MIKPYKFEILFFFEILMIAFSLSVVWLYLYLLICGKSTILYSLVIFSLVTIEYVVRRMIEIDRFLTWKTKKTTKEIFQRSLISLIAFSWMIIFSFVVSFYEEKAKMNKNYNWDISQTIQIQEIETNLR